MMETTASTLSPQKPLPLDSPCLPALKPKEEFNNSNDHGDDAYSEELFAKDGYIRLRNAIPVEWLQEWGEWTEMYFEKTFQILHDKGHTAFSNHRENNNSNNDHDHQYALGLGIKHGFREIVMRSPGRYELSLLHLQKSEFPMPISKMADCLFPLVPKLLHATDVSLCHISLLVSTPGSTDQGWHADGGHVSITQHLPCHVLNVFIPLEDVPMELGPTQFRPGTQVYTRKLAPMMLAAKAKKELRAPYIPLLQQGDALLFDYRVLHRGLANRSSENKNRTILVFSYCQSWFKDVLNFPSRSMYQPPSSSLEKDTSN